MSNQSNDVSDVSGLTKEYTNSIGMEFVLIPSGSFPRFVEDGNFDSPIILHVTISQPFYLGKYEVTQEQWVAVMGSNPSGFEGPRNPVDTVSWNNVQEFIQLLNQKEGHERYRLPTEAEWEYACRAGTTSEYSFGDNENEFERYMWCCTNSEEMTHPVGQKESNPWGLFDMHGNVMEWVQDLYGPYPARDVVDPVGLQECPEHVLRGGNWNIPGQYSRSAARARESVSGERSNCIGFRLALSPSQ